MDEQEPLYIDTRSQAASLLFLFRFPHVEPVLWLCNVRTQAEARVLSLEALSMGGVFGRASIDRASVAH